ncbi:hypothetical protein [Nannocystis sp.]|uniref:hypothetical protein n=1 Tax=Nannocystis sp. TaxID=1962667 RepID=UPI0025D43BD4|nr:hypothetical protein [Nannocystis sp.]MBK7826489.1 hypothetical protein [Nannocystis sp.]
MALYTNHSRHTSIVTVNIQSTANAQESLEQGAKLNFEKLKADVGFHDLVVDPGQELKVINDTVATVIGVRSNG